ncbi:tetratricopeptide repeat protein [Candidatus Poribacteria bacterium]|nr:tetratricopeptide repeat protein [Candidatus Poribacteria bacterium]
MKHQHPVFILSILILLLIADAASSADDYFNHITVFSDGKITRFTQMPIRVHIAPVPIGIEGVETYLESFRYAMREWEAAADGQIQFQEVKATDNADIRVRWQRSGLTRIIDTALGKTGLTRLSETDFEVDMVLALREIGSAALLSPEKMRTVCLHELGHAIGLWGHSSDSVDVLFFAATAQRPTDRDKATLHKVYATPPYTPQHEAAIAILKVQIETNPKHVRSHYLLGTVNFDKDEMDAAIANFKACLALNPYFQQANEKLLLAYQKSGRREEALVQLQKMLNREASPEGYNIAGVIYYQSQKIDEAIAAFKSALQINPRYHPAKNNLHQLYREQGIAALVDETYPQAIAFFSEALQLDPTDSTLYSLTGEVYAKSGDHQNAIAEYKKALQFNPGATDAKQNLARSYNNFGVQLTQSQRWEEAIDAYQQARQLMPDLASMKTNLTDLYWKRANTFREKGNLDLAIEAYRELLEFDSGAIDAHGLLGDLYFQKRDYPQAIRAFNAVFTADPENAQARNNLIAVYHKYGQVLDNQRRYAQAIAQLEAGLALAPAHINLRLSLAYVYEHAKDFDNAGRVFEEILELEPDNLQAKTGLVNLQIQRGNYLLNRKKYTAALKVFESIPESDRGIGIYNTIGYLYLMKKQPLKALPAFDAALASDPRDKVAYHNLLSIESQFEAQLNRTDNSQMAVDNLALVRNSLVHCLIGRDEHLKAKAKYRAALALDLGDTEIKAILINTGIRLAKAFQKKKWPKNMKEVIRWIQEQAPDNSAVQQLLEDSP